MPLLLLHPLASWPVLAPSTAMAPAHALFSALSVPSLRLHKVSTHLVVLEEVSLPMSSLFLAYRRTDHF
jgi:hypothetical protein